MSVLESPLDIGTPGDGSPINQSGSYLLRIVSWLYNIVGPEVPSEALDEQVKIRFGVKHCSAKSQTASRDLLKGA